MFREIVRATLPTAILITFLLSSVTSDKSLKRLNDTGTELLSGEGRKQNDEAEPKKRFLLSAFLLGEAIGIGLHKPRRPRRPPYYYEYMYDEYNDDSEKLLESDEFEEDSSDSQGQELDEDDSESGEQESQENALDSEE